MDMVRAHLIIEGLVQGVFFRATTADVAKKHGVFGWVKNNPDGSVEAMIEGREEDVKKVIGFCRIGPPRARVDRVDVRWEDYRDEFDDFHAVTRHSSY
ncbi:MAG: acylphosphatase [Deltaproteobacteria bacterium]|nr:acylphosphatase [Deltaproteobacteria bacterium]